jgi:hypothetical protein
MLRCERFTQTVFALHLLIMLGAILGSDASASPCTLNASPVASCDDLVISNSNLTISIPASVTLGGMYGIEVSGASGLTLTNSGTVSGTTAGLVSTVSTIQILTNEGTIGSLPAGNAINSGLGSDIQWLNNTGAIFQVGK